MAHKTRFTSRIDPMRLEMFHDAFKHEIQKHAYESGFKAGSEIGRSGGQLRVNLRTRIHDDPSYGDVMLHTEGEIEIIEQRHMDPYLDPRCRPPDYHGISDIQQAMRHVMSTQEAEALLGRGPDTHLRAPPVAPASDLSPKELPFTEQLRKETDEWLKDAKIEALEKETKEWLEGALE